MGWHLDRGLSILFSLHRPGPHQIVNLFYKQQHIVFFLKTEEILGFLHTIVITTVKSGTGQPTSAGRHSVTKELVLIRDDSHISSCNDHYH